MSLPKPVAIALSSIFAGAGAGGAVAALFAWVAWQQFQFLSVFGDPANTVFLGWAVGAIAAFALSWRLSSSITETWRRAAMAVTAALGAVGAGGGAQGIGMASMMSMSPLANYMLPGYCLVLAAVGFFAKKMNRKANAAP